MTVRYRIFDVHDPSGDFVAEGCAEFVPPLGTVILVDKYTYTVETHKAFHDSSMPQGFLNINIIELHCLRRDA